MLLRGGMFGKSQFEANLLDVDMSFVDGFITGNDFIMGDLLEISLQIQ
jgi:hypothetical protein